MKKSLMVLFAFGIISGQFSFGEKIKIGDIDDGLRVSVEQANQQRTVLKFEIGSFNRDLIEIDGEVYYRIALDNEWILHGKGEPALPRISRSVVIPDNARMKLNVLSSKYIDIENTPVAPSKGHIERTVDPETIPYTFGDVYNSDKWYPSSQAKIRDPYILRDMRGTTVEIYPFQYNPSTKTLRVYTSIEIEIVADGPGLANVLNRRHPYDSVDPDFEQVYRYHFINYNQGTLLYVPVPESGDMLIITYDDFLDEILPLADWKRQKGIKTTVVPISTIGNNVTQIDNFIQAFYDSTDLAWVLLVGDAAQIATPTASGGASDPSYAKVAGSDDYPDIFVGRFSAENLDHVITQVSRTIDYEKYPQAGAAWYHQATGIASDQGPGHYGEYDYQHMNNIRTDLLGYNFTLVDQIYDPSANPTMVANALNAGRSLVNYCGHGSVTSWGTSDFSNSDVNNLTNDGTLPFIYSVACVNGSFSGNTCFAEAWLRATNSGNGNPAGAMATYMSSINQDWDPPMYAQDEANDLLVAESKLTFGGICYNSACYMIDVDYTTGVKHYNTWHIFGDPSVMLTTDTPTAMTVTHAPSIIFTDTQYEVTVAGVEGALCALYYSGTLYGSAYTGARGIATIDIDQQLPVGQSLTLTVTDYNRLPYFGEVQAIALSGPYVVYDGHSIDDNLGNNNGMVDFGETISLGMQLENVGPDDAYNVSATLSSSDSIIAITDNIENFGTIIGNFGTVNITGAYQFDVALDAPDGHNIPLHLEITGTPTDTWTSDFHITVHAPIIEYAGLTIDDASGNGNGILEAGETAEILITLDNAGSGTAYAVTGVLTESDDYVTIDDAGGTFGDLAYNEWGDNSADPFVITASPDFPPGHAVALNLAIAANGGFNTDLQFMLRTAESFEYSNGGYVGEGNWQWGEPTSGPQGAYFGTKVWATVLSGNYQNSRDDDLKSAPVFIHSAEAALEFYHWYDIENYYDGGNVQVSTDGGSSWNLIFPDGNYPSAGIYALDQPGYTNVSSGWVQAQFSLASYVGHEVIIKWRFASDGYVDAPGWYIDDVEITGNMPLPPPDLAYDPSSFSVSGQTGDIITRELTLTNNGDGPLYYNLIAQMDDRLAGNVEMKIAPKSMEIDPEPFGFYPASDKRGSQPEPIFPDIIADAGGPDAFGYTWIDSDDPVGPVFNWKDITSIGTLITGLGDESNVGPFPIGFDFDFYGSSFSSFRFCSNGYISFTSSNSIYTNVGLPSGAQPFNLVAPFWDDLNFFSGGTAYYYSNNSDSLIISFINVPHYGSSGPLGPYTFQIILLSDGKIIYQYLDINDPVISATVGIQNADGTIGLSIAYNAAYPADNLAVLIRPETEWLTIEPASGIIPANGSGLATITFDATDLDAGTCTGSIIIESNDPVNSNVTLPVTFIVGQAGYPDIVWAPDSFADTLTEGEQSMHCLSLSNEGDADLVANFTSGQSWISLGSESISVSPGLTDSLEIMLDASSLDPGDYAGTISISCNDPDQSSMDIGVTLHVISAYLCEYMPGDINSDNQVIGSDITYAVGFFRGIGPPPPDSCYNEQTEEWLYVAADANGDCRFIGSDVTFLVAYFRGLAPSPDFCPDLPPSNPAPAVERPYKEDMPAKSE